MKIIEICGPPCSGKTYIYNKLKKKFNKKIFDPENLILNNIEKYIDLNLKEKASLFYFKNSNFFKKKIKSDSFKKAIKKAIKKKVNNQNLSNFFLVEYNKLCEKLYTVLKKKNPKFFLLVEKKIFKELKILDKKNNKRWFYECICKFYIAKNLKLKKITIFDEGILQRLSMIIKLNKKKNVLNDLFKLVDLSDVILLKDSKIKDLKARSIKRSVINNQFQYKDNNQINDYKQYFQKLRKFLLKKKETKIIDINKNNINVKQLYLYLNKKLFTTDN
tara:strand:+ start:27304 stop:28128 length:825 start_codon:yes stop_codon:yes gene_type:complete